MDNQPTITQLRDYLDCAENTSRTTGNPSILEHARTVADSRLKMMVASCPQTALRAGRDYQHIYTQLNNAEEEA